MSKMSWRDYEDEGAVPALPRRTSWLVAGILVAVLALALLVAGCASGGGLTPRGQEILLETIRLAPLLLGGEATATDTEPGWRPGPVPEDVVRDPGAIQIHLDGQRCWMLASDVESLIGVNAPAYDPRCSVSAYPDLPSVGRAMARETAAPNATQLAVVRRWESLLRGLGLGLPDPGPCAVPDSYPETWAPGSASCLRARCWWDPVPGSDIYWRAHLVRCYPDPKTDRNWITSYNAWKSRQGQNRHIGDVDTSLVAMALQSDLIRPYLRGDGRTLDWRVVASLSQDRLGSLTEAYLRAGQGEQPDDACEWLGWHRGPIEVATCRSVLRSTGGDCCWRGYPPSRLCYDNPGCFEDGETDDDEDDSGSDDDSDEGEEDPPNECHAALDAVTASVEAARQACADDGDES